MQRNFPKFHLRAEDLNTRVEVATLCSKPRLGSSIYYK